MNFFVRHRTRSETLDPTVTELRPLLTRPVTRTAHQVRPSISDPINIRRTINEALSEYSLPDGRSCYKVGLVDVDERGPSSAMIIDSASRMRRADGFDARHYRHMERSTRKS
jgi:hypothetical protein